MKIYLAKAVGTGPTTLSAFDAALNSCGIANYNLLRLSSVIPPSSTLVEAADSGVAQEVMPGQWGDRLYVVMADYRTATVGEQAWAGIGWVQDTETGKGLFVEHEGNSEDYVRQSIEASLKALMATRNIDFGEIKMIVAGGTCTAQPICAMAVAVYQSSSWDNKAEQLT